MDGIQKISDSLFLIGLNQSLPGFTDFISAYLFSGRKRMLIDPGPSSTALKLISTLEFLGIDSLDYILLTHVHLDHAGGIADILCRFPDAKVFCHPKAVPHLKDPSRLWEASLSTLKEIALAYGEIRPVAGKNLFDALKNETQDFKAFPTPGHAPHHLSFLVDDLLFAGEACGVNIPCKNGLFYHRPATPPRFFLETATKSIQTILKLPFKTVCFAHFGTSSGSRLIEKHKEQLKLWAYEIKEELLRGDSSDIYLRCMKRLLKNDPLLANYDMLEKEVRLREEFFFKNSISGFIGYLNESQKAVRI